MNAPEDMLRRIKTIFLKNGHVTENTVLGNSDHSLIAEARKALGIEEWEDLILVSKVSECQLTAVTCTKILWRDGTKTGAFDLHGFKSAEVNLAEMKLKGMMLHTADRLNVTLNSGEVVRIPAEAGSPLCGLWNALIAVAHDNARWRSQDAAAR